MGARNVTTLGRFVGAAFYSRCVYWRLVMMRRMLTSLLAAFFLAGLFGTVAGCNTVAGAGQDIEQGGRALKNEANEHK